MGNQIKEWDLGAKAYSKLANSLEEDAYEYEINFPSIAKMLPERASCVLEIGCGNGVFTKKIAEIFPKAKIRGTDGSSKMVEICKSKPTNITFEVLNLSKPFNLKSNQYDLVLSKMVLMFLDDLELLAKETYRVTKQNGLLIISCYHPFYWLVKDNRIEDYFKTTKVKKAIAGKDSLKFDFIFRSLSEHVSPFNKAGWHLEKIDEPSISKEFLDNNSQFKNKNTYPMRLNMRFRKC